MKIMVFLHGTAIMHRSALGQAREKRVRQVLERDESVHDYASYVPVGNAVQKLQAWRENGAEIHYLSSHIKTENIEKDKLVLRKFGFPEGPIHFRRSGEEYKDIVESVLPNVLIEDDCESIGGEIEMTYPHIRPDLKPVIKSIIVKEFGGIDHLPDNLSDLEQYDR